MKSQAIGRKVKKGSTPVVRFRNEKPKDEDSDNDDDVYVQSSMELSDNGLIKMLTDEIQYNIGEINLHSNYRIAFSW
jgi:hypothetical protein